MELTDLRTVWQSAEGPAKSGAELQKMTRIANHPSLKQVRKKILIETVGLTLFLFLYQDWFDGDQKPLYVNLLLITSVVLYILTDLIGYVSIAYPIQGLNIRLSMQNYLVQVQRLSFFSLFFSFVYSLAILVFFTSVIHFTREKYLILLGITASLLVMLYLSFRFWTQWISLLKQQVAELMLDTAE